MRAALVFLILAVLSTAAVSAEVAATLAPQMAHVGDTLRLELRLNGAGGRTVQFPRRLEDKVSVLKVDSSRLTSQATIGYTIALYDTGHFTLSDYPVVLGRGAAAETLYTPAVSVAITPVTPDTAAAIRPNKPYREHPFQWRELLGYWWLPAGIAIAFAAWWIWRKFFSRKAKEEAAAAIPLLPPHDEAVRSLIELKSKNYPARGMLKEFFSEYSLIMRRYLERRYEFPALEMTTFDLARHLEESSLPDALEQRLLPVLREADLVKFAKHVPDFRMCEAHIDSGFELVDLTKERPQPELAEEKAA
ncbi:MAG TPA: hypothetical protein VGL38_02010 [bacterium]|jgi:hypothetical protein